MDFLFLTWTENLENIYRTLKTFLIGPLSRIYGDVLPEMEFIIHKYLFISVLVPVTMNRRVLVRLE